MIQTSHGRLWEQASDAHKAAIQRGSTLDEVREARAAVQKFVDLFPGAPEYDQALQMVEVLNAAWQRRRLAEAGIGQLRGPKPRKPLDAAQASRDEEAARMLLRKAKDAFEKDKNWLLAFALADNIAFNLSYTSSGGRG